MRYAKVIVGLPVDRPFDYIIPQGLGGKVRIGCRVLIPFRNKRLVGYVIGLTYKTKVKKLKPILKLIDIQPLLDKKFLSLLKEVSIYYCSTWAEAIETALPIAIRKGRTIEIISSQKQVSPNQETKFEVILLYDLEGNKRYDIYFEEIERILNLNRSIIFLCPEVRQVLKVKDLLQEKFKQKIVTIHRKLTQNEELKAWRDIKENKNLICVGTRSAIFSPVCDLGLIILDSEENENYKQDQKPFYHARQVAIMRAKLERVKLILGSTTPSLESYFLAKKKKYTLIKLERKKKLPQINLIDMRSELINRKGGTVISKFLETKIEQMIREKKKVLIFLNRLGFATYNYCKSCGFVLKCPRCNVSLTYLFEKKRLICNYCRYSCEVPVLCPNCNSNYIRFKGLGLERLESQLYRIFPQAKILKLEKDYSQYLSDNWDILISTSQILKEEFIKEFDLLGIILADQSLNLIDFRAQEKAFSLFYKLILLCKERAIIQTYLPENYSLKYLSEGDKFYKEELRQRRLLNFPPFMNLVIIRLRGEREDTLVRKSQLLFKKIKLRNKKVEVFFPTQDFPSKLRGKYRYMILIKVKDVKKLSLSLKKVLSSFSHSGITITVDTNPL